MGANSDVEDQKNDDDKSAVPMDTEDNESPSQPDDSDTKSEEPDNSISTLHHIGVAYGYDNDDVYIPTSAEVYNSIDQDHLFARTNDNNITLNEEAPAFLGMVLTANDNDNEPESEPEDMNDIDSEPLPIGFDVNDPINVLAMAIHCAALDQTSSEAVAESLYIH